MSKSRINLALIWSLLVLIVIIIGFSVNDLLTKNLDDRDYAITLLLTLSLIGLFIGLTQLLAIGFKIKNGWTWIAATAVGFSVGTFLSFIMITLVAQNFLGPENRHVGAYQWVEQIAAHMLTGMFIGALQWLVLRRKLITSLRWLLLSGVSLVIGHVVNVFVANLFSLNDIDFSIRFGTIGGLVFALLTCAFARPLIMRSEFTNA